jgi:methionyl-tRNA formyltransferase
MRVIFMGSPQIAVPALEQLAAGNYNLVAVYTQPDRPAGRGMALAVSPVKAAAMRLGLKVFQPENFKQPSTLEELAQLKPDIIAVCAFGQILTQALLDIPPYQCVNVHYSLLPRHRGAAPVMATLLAGDAYAGVTVQLVRRKLDTGPLLAAAAIPVTKQDTTGSISEKLSVIGAQLLDEALTGWLRGEIKPIEQDENKATYFGQINKEEGIIDWSKPAEEIWRSIKAFQPWPGAYTSWKGKQLKINQAEIVDREEDKAPGTVIALPGQKHGVGVVTGKGVLRILNLQYEGKKAMDAGVFVHGQQNFMGVKLGE